MGFVCSTICCCLYYCAGCSPPRLRAGTYIFIILRSKRFLFALYSYSLIYKGLSEVVWQTEKPQLYIGSPSILKLPCSNGMSQCFEFLVKIGFLNVFFRLDGFS